MHMDTSPTKWECSGTYYQFHRNWDFTKNSRMSWEKHDPMASMQFSLHGKWRVVACFERGSADRSSNKTRGVNLSSTSGRESYPRPRSHGLWEHPNIEGSAFNLQWKTWGVETAPENFKIKISAKRTTRNDLDKHGQTVCANCANEVCAKMPHLSCSRRRSWQFDSKCLGRSWQ